MDTSLDARTNPFAALDGAQRKKMADAARRIPLPAVRYLLRDRPDEARRSDADPNRWLVRRIRKRALVATGVPRAVASAAPGSEAPA